MIKLFSGTANPVLTSEVAKILGIPVSKSEVIRFDNSEVRVRIEDSVKNDICVVIQSTANPTDTNLIELFLFCDALKRQEARKVIGVIPYFGYARQNRAHRDGECISVNVVIRILESIGFDKVYTFDLHDEGTEGVFKIPFKNLTTYPLLAETIKEYVGSNDKNDIAIVSPDQGGIERARDFGRYLFGNDSFHNAVIEKKRDQDHIHQSQALDLFGDVKNKVAVIVDDVITSGGTLVHAVELCMQQGAKKVVAAIPHHDLSEKAPGRLNDSKIEKIFSTNTIALKEEFAIDKISETSIAQLIAEELKDF